MHDLIPSHIRRRPPRPQDGVIVFYEFIDALLAHPDPAAAPRQRDAALYEKHHPTVRF